MPIFSLTFSGLSKRYFLTTFGDKSQVVELKRRMYLAEKACGIQTYFTLHMYVNIEVVFGKKKKKSPQRQTHTYTLSIGLPKFQKPT